MTTEVLAPGTPEPSPPPDAHTARSRLLPTNGHRLAALVALAVVFAGLYLSYPRPFRKEPVFTSPRQSVGYELARQWADHGKPQETLPLYDRVPADIAPAFTPRDAASRNGKVVPKDFPLVVALFAAAHRVNSNLVPLVDPLMGVLALMVFALLAWELTRSRIAVWLAGILFASTTSFWSSSAWIYAPDTAAVCVVLLAIYAFVRAARSSSRSWFAVGGVACALAFGFRYDNAIIVGVLWIAFVLGHRAQWRRWLIVPAVAAIGSLPFAAFNAWMYGSPKRTGYALAYKLIDQTANIKGRGLLGVSSSLFAKQAHIYLLRPEILLIMLAGLGGLVLVLRERDDRTVVALGWGTLAVTAGIVAYAGTRNLTGATSFTVSSSFLRYMLPSFAMFSIFAAAAVAHRTRAVKIGAFAIAIVVAALAMHTNVYANGGVKQTDADVRLRRLQSDAVFNSTPSDAIVITQLGSKALWPNRQVLSTAFLVKNDRPVTVDDETNVWSLRPSLGRLTDVIVRLTREHLHVYLLNDQTWLKPPQLAGLTTNLGENHVQMTQLLTGYVNLFRFELK
ncbi:MAG TPA: glycosyltransferase family 39 protein [Acidimicrobiia bacterium]|nr:glycosyltransferase family 39 protein [Acidimicrobiia bacterium]